LEIHSFGVQGLRDYLSQGFKVINKTGKFLLGLGLVENAYDETMAVQAMTRDEVLKEEPKLLKLAFANMPYLPVDDIDLLILQRQGKDISGTGMDPNIIGRIKIAEVPEPASPRIKSIVVTDITEGSHGNAVGVGFADVITQRLYDKIDIRATWENVVTSTFLERGKIPLVARNAEEACGAAARTIRPFTPESARVVYVKDTLHLSTAYVSPAVFQEIKDSVEVLSDYRNILDDQGELVEI
jgi:hypothetical protein